MFDKVTEKFKHDARPMVMQKRDGAYRGISFSEMRTMAESFAIGLSHRGVKRGDMIGLISENRPEWVLADIGTMLIGAVSVPLYPTMTSKQIEFVFRDAGTRFAIVSNQLQLKKVIRIFDQIPTLEALVLLNDKIAAEDSRVIPLRTLLNCRSRSHLDIVPQNRVLDPR